MEMSGERIIAADRAAVWAALNDADVLKACISGCQEMHKTSPTEFTAKVVQKVGPVKATFTGEVELKDIVEGESYRIEGRGKGGAAGGASGGAAVRLEDVDGGTRLTYEAEAKVTGKIAQLGARLINGFAKKMADDFFTKFQEQVEGPAEAETPEGPADDKSIGDRVGETVDDAVEGAKELAGKAGETVRELADQAETVAKGIAEKAENATRTAAGRLADKIEEAEPEKKGFWRRLLGL